MALHGHTILELSRERKVNNRIKKEVVHRIEKDNVVTGYVSGVFGKGNFNALIPSNKLMPLYNQFFSGCILTDIENDATGSILAGNANITAQASNGDYVEPSGGYNTRRGLFQADQSGYITEGDLGYQFVWEWATGRGIGDISSVCLCRPSFGACDFSKTRIPTSAEAISETLYSGDNTGALAQFNLGCCNLVDYANDRAYAVSYSNGVITIKIYRLSCENIHFLSVSRGLNNECDLIDTKNIAQTIDDWINIACASVSLVNGKIHLFTIKNYDESNVRYGRITDYIIDTTDWTAEVEIKQHAYANLYLVRNPNSYLYSIPRDAIVIEGTYIYALVDVDGAEKVAKCNLLGATPASITLLDVPTALADACYGNRNRSNVHSSLFGPTSVFPNGDWIKYRNYGGGHEGMYYHNGEIYAVYVPENVASYGGVTGLVDTGYGTILSTNTSALGTYSSRLDIFTSLPYVSTINNLGTTVRKTDDVSMKLIYRVTEATS